MNAWSQTPSPPVILDYGIRHGATFQILSAPPFSGMPAGLAPGALFRIQGEGLGPQDPVTGTAPYGLRLPDTLGGTEVHVRSLGTGKVAQASIVYAGEHFVAAILPRNFPLGDAEVRAWYQGMASEPSPVPIVYSFPGLFTITQNGHGHGVIHNYEPDGSPTINGLTHAAAPGYYVTLWGTGLGDAGGDEVQVYFGDDEFYPATYAGPAPGAPGVDQINVLLPADLPDRGCYVRVVVGGDGLGSGPAYISIADEPGPCAHPWELSADRLAEIEAGGRATSIEVFLTDSAGGSSAGATLSTLSEAELELSLISEAKNEDLFPVVPGVCSSQSLNTYPPGTLPFPQPAPAQQTPPDSPPWLLTGPGGRTLELAYNASYASSDTFASDFQDPGFVAPGEWLVRIPSGSAIDALEFTARMTPTPDVVSPQVLQRGLDFELSWPAGELEEGDQVMAQAEVREPVPDTPGATRGERLTCTAFPGASSVHIPLSQLQEPFEGAVEVKVTFSVESVQTPASPAGADHIKVTARATRGWSIPLQ